MRDMIKKMTGRRRIQYKRLSQRCVNNKKGVSLVGVIVAFLLLMIIMLMFQKSLKVSGNLLARSVATAGKTHQSFTLEMEQLDMKIIHQPRQMEVMSSEEDKRQQARKHTC